MGHFEKEKESKAEVSFAQLSLWVKQKSQWVSCPSSRPSFSAALSLQPWALTMEVSFPLPPENRWVMWWRLFQHLLEFCFVLFSTSFWEVLHSLEVQQNCLIPDRQHHCLDPVRPIQLGESSDQQEPSLKSTTAELLSTEFKLLEMQIILSFFTETCNPDPTVIKIIQVGQLNPNLSQHNHSLGKKQSSFGFRMYSFEVFLTFILRTPQSKSKGTNLIQILNLNLNQLTLKKTKAE